MALISFFPGPNIVLEYSACHMGVALGCEHDDDVSNSNRTPNGNLSEVLCLHARLYMMTRRHQGFSPHQTGRQVSKSQQ